jgi:hypothetical protein
VNVDRRLHVPLYVLFILVFTSFAGPALSVMIAVALADEAVDDAVAEAVERDRQQTCIEHGAVITVLRQANPSTAAGSGLLRTYDALYAINECEARPPDPPR